jgi:hypothetical protein
MIETANSPVIAKSFKISVSDSGKETDENSLPNKYILPDRKAFVDTEKCEICEAVFGGLISGRHHW